MKKATILQRVYNPVLLIHAQILSYGVLLMCGLFSLVVTGCKTDEGLSQVQTQNTVAVKLIQVNDVYEIAPSGRRQIWRDGSGSSY